MNKSKRTPGHRTAPRDSLVGAAAPGPEHIQYICDLHDLAGDMQRDVLGGYPGTLPTPLRGDPEYYDGAQFYKLHISDTLEAAGRESVSTPDQHVLLVSTNGLNDWWMDESYRDSDGRRRYDKVIDVFNGINAICYSCLRPTDPGRAPITVSDPEAQHVVNYYQYVLEQMPERHRSFLAKILISINLYQGISLYQEQGFREHMRLAEIKNHEENRQMLDRMRVEKGGIIFTYFWPYFTEIAEGIKIPGSPPTISDTLQNFFDGNSLYPEDGVGRRLLEIGGVNQTMDDSIDRVLDSERGVISPANFDGAFTEDRNLIVKKILQKLNSLRGSDDDGNHKLVVDAGVEAIAGLTLFRANREKSKKERARKALS